MNKLLYLLLIAVCWSCSQDSETEKHQSKRDQVVDVRDKMKEFSTQDVLIGRISRTYLIDNYLIVTDYNSPDKLIHLFDKNTFEHLASSTYQGQGPDEITIIGHVGIDETNRRFFVSDHGKLKIFAYDLDSVLTTPEYQPSVKIDMKKKLFPDDYLYLNDTLCIAKIIEPIGNNDYKPSVARWNIATEEINPMPYEYPDLKKVRFIYAASAEHQLYVQCYTQYDLMTICDFNGNLKCNIYGPKWVNEKTQTQHYSLGVEFCGDKILALYSGGDHRTDAYYPTKFLVFDLNGNYLKTLETGYMITDFCYDKENNRLIINLNDEIQFAYLDLEGII